MLTLLPLSLSEIEFKDNINKEIFNGGYPRLKSKSIDPNDFYRSYIKTYVEKDVRQIKNIEDLVTFHNFLELCAGRTGQLLNVAPLASDAGISHNTAKNWLNLLEASYICFRLRPYHKNFNKRLVKMSKLYFYDTGLVCSL